MQDDDHSLFQVRLGLSGKGDPLVLRNPVIAAAGCFPLQARRWTADDVWPLGAACTPSIAVRTRTGGTNFAITEAPAGLLLRGGYPTVSPRRLREEIGPRWQAAGAPLIATVRATDPDECLAVVAALSETESIAAIELTLAEPERIGRTPGDVSSGPKLTERVRRLWPGALIVKLFPAVAAGSGLAGQLELAGADAISIGGGFGAMAGGAEEVSTAATLGRLVGPATRPLALRQTAGLARASRLPVIACGGITSAIEVLEFLAAGAVAVQVGSVALRSPLAAVEIARGVEERLVQRAPPPEGRR